MGHPTHHHHINYLEFSTTDIERTKKFYATVFGWSFTDYGPDYASFNAASAGIDGGFAKGAAHEGPGKFAPLIVLYSANLKATEAAIVSAGGSIVVPTFEFPGGREHCCTHLRVSRRAALPLLRRSGKRAGCVVRVIHLD